MSEVLWAISLNGPEAGRGSTPVLRPVPRADVPEQTVGYLLDFIVSSNAQINLGLVHRVRITELRQPSDGSSIEEEGGLDPRIVFDVAEAYVQPMCSLAADRADANFVRD